MALSLPGDHRLQRLQNMIYKNGWRRSVVISGLASINAISTWMGDRLWAGKPSRYVTNHLGQLSLPSLRGR